MSQPTMEEIIEQALAAAGTTEFEIAGWVSDLKALHHRELKREGEREAQLDRQTELCERVIKDLQTADQRLKDACQTITDEQGELQKIRKEFEHELHGLTETIEGLSATFKLTKDSRISSIIDRNRRR